MRRLQLLQPAGNFIVMFNVVRLIHDNHYDHKTSVSSNSILCIALILLHLPTGVYAGDLFSSDELVAYWRTFWSVQIKIKIITKKQAYGICTSFKTI